MGSAVVGMRPGAESSWYARGCSVLCRAVPPELVIMRRASGLGVPPGFTWEPHGQARHLPLSAAAPAPQTGSAVFWVLMVVATVVMGELAAWVVAVWTGTAGAMVL